MIRFQQKFPMKTKAFPRSILLATGVCCALAAPNFAFAQPEAPVAADAATPTKPRKNKKPKGDKQPRDKKLAPRVVAATEAALGKPLTPEMTAQLTASMRERDAAVKAANDAYYAAFAGATGLTLDQAREINKPARNGANAAKPTTEPKAEGTTDMDELTVTQKGADAPVTPK